MAARAAGAEPGGPDLVDLADDLDDDLDDDGDDGARTAGGGGPVAARAGRRALFAVTAAAALVVVAGLGAAAGAAHAGARAAVREHELLVEHSLHAGALEVGGPGAVSGGTTRIAATAPLANDGPLDLELAVTSISAGAVTGGTGFAPQRLRPGASARIPVVVQVACDRVPSPGQAATSVPAASSAPASVALAVRVSAAGDAPRQVEVPLAADDAERFAADLATACHPDQPGAVSATWTWLPDGHLRLGLVTGSASTEPVRVTAQGSRGITVTAVPALPLVVAAGQQVDVDLSVDVDCAAVGDGSSSGLAVSASDEAGTSTAELGAGATSDGTPYGTSAWLARRIALACG